MKNKDNMDEMQRGILLRIEETAVNLVFWVLLAAIIIQLLMGQQIRYILGELCAFALLSGYLALSTLRNGLWAVGAAPDRKRNALVSLVPAAVIGAFSFVKAFILSGNGLSGTLLKQLVLTMAATYVGCFLLLEIMRAIQKKRRQKLDDEEE